jgi:Flp pilus assembly protein TadD
VNRCPNCKTEILFESAEFCEHCGVSLVSSKDRTQGSDDPDEKMDFEVSESIADRSDDTGKYSRSKPVGDDLGVQSSAEWVQSQTLDDEPAPATPTPTEALQSPTSSTNPPDRATGSKDADPALHRLSADEVKKIEQRLYSESSAAYLSAEEKRDLLKNMQGIPTVKTAATPPPLDGAPRPAVSGSAPDLPRPQLAKRGRGVAHFVGNWIQVQGGLELHEMDELQINDRAYLLKKKRLSPKTVSIAAGSLFVILLFVVGSMFLTRSTDGKGELIGVVLDSHLQPNQEGATVRVADLGLSVVSNGQGLFRTDRLPAGSHKIEYVVNGQVVGTDYATIAAGQSTLMTLRPSDALASTPTSSTPGIVSAPPQTSVAQAPQQLREEASNPSSTDRPAPTRSAGDQLGRIMLKANIEGARFSLNGSVLGAGNVTYTRIKPGKHNYTVSADGYQTLTGTVDVGSGETQVLAVELTSAATVPTQKSSGDEYSAAVALLRTGRAPEAVTALTEVIQHQPSSAEAYSSRGEAYMALVDKKSAHDDYVRSAEIYRAKGSGGEAMTEYNSALRANPQSVTALLGRASLHLEHGEEIAAITDYEAVLKIDKRNAQAYYGLGESRYNQGNYKEAIKHFKDARSLEPDNPKVYQDLMLAYMGDDDFKNVKKSFDKFKELATQEQMSRMQSDKRFGAVLRIVATDEQ